MRDPPEEVKRKPDQKSYLEEEARWPGRKLVEVEARGLVWAFAEGSIASG